MQFKIGAVVTLNLALCTRPSQLVGEHTHFDGRARFVILWRSHAAWVLAPLGVVSISTEIGRRCLASTEGVIDVGVAPYE